MEEKNLQVLAYKTLLSTYDFYELWQIYKGLKKMVEDGYPIVIDDDLIITDERDAILFTKTLIREIELRVQKNNNNNNNKKEKPDKLSDDERLLEDIDLLF